jgi:hypothetical protein
MKYVTLLARGVWDSKLECFLKLSRNININIPEKRRPKGTKKCEETHYENDTKKLS